MNLEDLNKEIEKFQKISNREYLPLYAQGKLDAYLELLPLVKKLTLTDVVESDSEQLCDKDTQNKALETLSKQAQDLNLGYD